MNCENCGSKIYSGICPNCQEELYIHETQNEFLPVPLSEEFKEKVSAQKEENKKKQKNRE